MQDATLLLVLADVVLLMHVAIVVFIVGGLALIIAGGIGGWHWVRNPWFRIAHLVAIGVVTAQAWMGMVCPLTTLEKALRASAGETVYAGSFIAHWVGALLYYHAPMWVFAAAYTVFGLLVAAAWWKVRPGTLRSRRIPWIKAART